MARWRVWSESDAREELALLKASGQSLAKFARSRGYDDSRLRWWRKRLGDGGPLRATALVPVHVVGVDKAATETPVEVALGSGHVVRVRRGFDADALASVVRALDGSC